jgi:hypothetical protein
LNQGGLLQLEGVIVAGNVAVTNRDVAGTFTSLRANLIQDLGSSEGSEAHDLIGVDPWLAPLDDSGGPLFTYALREGSPAIDAIPEGPGPSVDQRGQPRPSRGGFDLGAYERGELPPGPRFVWARVNASGDLEIRVGGEGIVLEYSDDLREWSPSDAAPVDGIIREPANRTARFYRLRAEPSPQ